MKLPYRGRQSGRPFSAVCAAAIAFLAATPCTSAFAQDRTLYLQKNTDARNFDPHKILSRSVAEILPFVIDTLVSIEDDLSTVRPGLASSWEMAPDGRTFTFTLKDSLKFCDGKALTASNVETTFKRWLDPATKSVNTVILGPLVSVTATDAKTVVFKLSEPYPEFLIQLAAPYAGIIDVDEAQQLGDKFAVATMNGSGPYCWEHWRPREEIAMKANPHYNWGTAVYDNKGPAKVDRVVFKIMPEDNARVAALLTGQSHASYYVPWTSIPDIRKNPNFEIVQPRAFGWIAFIGVKTHRPLMEPAVRKAMNYAVDRDGIVDALYAGNADPAPFAVSPKFDGYNKSLDAKLPKYDPAMAKKILDEAGWKLGSDGVRVKNGVKLAPLLIGYLTWRERLEAVQGMMREVGIDLKLELSDTPVAVARMLGKDDFDMWGYFGSYSTVGEVLTKYFLSTEPVAPYRYAPEQGKDIDALIRAARIEVDKPKRDAMYAKVQDMVADGYFWVPLTHERMLIAYNKTKVTGMKPHGLAGNGLYKGLDFVFVK